MPDRKRHRDLRARAGGVGPPKPASLRQSNPYLANVAPGNDLFVPTDPIPSATMTTYDGTGGTYSYVYTYHSNGALNSTRIPVTGDLKRETLEYNYDALGQPATQKTGYGTSPQTSLVTSTGYTSFGELAPYQLRNNDGSTVDVLRGYDQFTRYLVGRATAKSPTGLERSLGL
jgi:hypothetical protein